MIYESEKKLESLTNYIGKTNKTNCYLFYPQLKQMLKKSNVQIEFGKKSTYLFIEKDNCVELFYFVNKITDLIEESIFLKNILPTNKRVIISIILKNGSNAEYGKTMEKLGFSLYKKYIRKRSLVNGSIHEVQKDESISFAEANDIVLIQRMIDKTFDRVSDQFPNREELERMIFQKQVWKYESMDALKGFLINERQGKKSYLRMLCIESKYRGNGIGKKLLQTYIKSECKSCELFYLWVDEKNEKAIKLYEKQGYVSDGLEQFIYIN